MILRYERLHRFPPVFKSMTGLTVAQFDALSADVLPRFHAADFARLNRPNHKRAVGGGPGFDLEPVQCENSIQGSRRHYAAAR